MQKIKNYSPQMHYKCFGRTGEIVSSITLGGMRYVKGFKKPKNFIPRKMLRQCTETVKTALSFGINTFETAYGYGRSEKCYGIVLNEILNVPRDSYYLMTKSSLKTASDIREKIKKQLTLLQTDYFDFYAWHGINTYTTFENITQKQGVLDELVRMKDEGIIHHLGFSTHGPMEVIQKTIDTNYFDFVNLHYYYFFQKNLPAVNLAHDKNLGVLIISPNDKGGNLYKPSRLLVNLTAPYTPIQWNARFCLKDDNVQTLAFGMNKQEQFRDIKGIFKKGNLDWDEKDNEILARMDQRLDTDPYGHYNGDDINDNQSGINIPEVLRMRKLWKCYDMEAFGIYRYNMFREDEDWFPGKFATKENLKKIDDAIIPREIPLKKLLLETHNKFYRNKIRRFTKL